MSITPLFNHVDLYKVILMHYALQFSSSAPLDAFTKLVTYGTWGFGSTLIFQYLPNDWILVATTSAGWRVRQIN
jgi:hypothetical protein